MEAAFWPQLHSARRRFGLVAMQAADSVVVYSLRLHPARPENLAMAAFKAPLDVIKALGGEPVAGTAQAVPRSELDRQGRYRRIATGWGELD